MKLNEVGFLCILILSIQKLSIAQNTAHAFSTELIF